MVDAVCHLNSLCKRKATDDLKDLLNDVAWHKETLPLEMMAMLEQVDYDSSDTELHELLCRLNTGTSATKDLLESSFAHLQSIAQRQNKNKKMNMYTKWTYAIANPHATNSAPQLFPDSKDWVEASSFGREKHEEFIKCGSVRTEALPEVKVGEHSLFPHTAQDELLNCVHFASIIKGTISMIKGKNERIHHFSPPAR
jgi:hypothetical protein